MDKNRAGNENLEKIPESQEEPLPAVAEDILPLPLVEKLVDNVEMLPFKCDLCPNGYKREGNLKRHIEAKHKNLNGSTCKECGAVFGAVTALEKHMNTHLKCKV